MIQQELFSPAAEPHSASVADNIDLRSVLENLATNSARPRYAFMVLNLIANAAGPAGRAGPYVRETEGLVPVRDWLCDALTPMAQRKPQRRATVEGIRREMKQDGTLPADADEAQALIDAEVKNRVRQSGRANVSRAVSELVRAGLLTRHYQGYRIDHQNRGGQRQAVYTVTREAQLALGLVL